MIYAVSGAQGCGKTTTLEHLKQLGFNVVSRKASRSILSDWGMTLDEVNSQPELAVSFQQEILRRKLCDDTIDSQGTDIWFTERSPIDLMTYATITLGQFNTYSDFINDYYECCVRALSRYDGLIYITNGVFAPVHDGVRGSNVHYARMVDVVMRDNIQRMCHDATTKLLYVTAAGVEDRADQIIQFVT